MWFDSSSIEHSARIVLPTEFLIRCFNRVKSLVTPLSSTRTFGRRSFPGQIVLLWHLPQNFSIFHMISHLFALATFVRDTKISTQLDFNQCLYPIRFRQYGAVPDVTAICEPYKPTDVAAFLG